MLIYQIGARTKQFGVKMSYLIDILAYNQFTNNVNKLTDSC